MLGRKLFILVASVVLLAASVAVCSADEVDLVGEWQGPIAIHAKDRGFIFKDENKGKFIIIEQQNGVFYGKKVWTDSKGQVHEEEFSGLISKDGSKFYFAEYNDGYAFGEIAGPDDIVVYYLEGGDNAKAFRRDLKRTKQAGPVEGQPGPTRS